MSGTDRRTVRQLRALRRGRRLGDLEWFDVAYRVYLFGLAGLIATVMISDAIGQVVSDDVTTDELLAKGPATLGLLMMAAIAVGLRGGSEGGPISVESADVRHLLMAPVDRRMVLLRPIGQRMRSVAFGLALATAVLGQLVARELEGSRGSWAAAGALFGAIVGVAYVAAAVISHALRIHRWLATGLGIAGVAWQAIAAWSVWSDDPGQGKITGPADAAGGVALWGIRVLGIEVVAVGAVVGAVLLALALGGRLRIEPLVRRADLVSQLKFAATVQDLRTVVLLRRQLRAEHLRVRPWGAPTPRPIPSSAPDPGSRPRSVPMRAAGAPKSAARMVHRRGVASLRRLPAARLARIAMLAALGGIFASLTVSGSPLLAIGVVGAVFLLGLECVEPLSQEIDRPDLTDGVPVERGWIYAQHLVAPGGLVAGAALVGATAVAVFEPDHAAGAFAVAIPVAWAGAIGSVIATVRDSPQPSVVADTKLTGAARNTDSPLVPPEFAGAQNAFSSFMPILVSGIAALPVLAMRAEPTAGTAVRSAVGVALALLLLSIWIRKRDRWAIGIRRFIAEGKEAM
jgi:hypothetical protein